MSFNFYKLTSNQLAQHLPFFSTRPNYVFFANAVRFQLENRLPNHPCDFYLLESESKNSKYFYCIRHNLLPDESRPILLIGYLGSEEHPDHEQLLCRGLEEIGAADPNLEKVSLVLGFRNVLQKAKSFLMKKYGLKEIAHNPCYTFYVHPDNYKYFLDYEPDLPAKYALGKTRVEDAEIVNSTWKFAGPGEILQQIEKISRLPTACIFHDNNPIAFEMVGLHGQLSHQFTFPEYRNQGLGAIVEKTIVKRCIEFGILPYKSVEIINEKVLERSQNSKGWSTAMDEFGNPSIFDYVVLKKE